MHMNFSRNHFYLIYKAGNLSLNTIPKRTQNYDHKMYAYLNL